MSTKQIQDLVAELTKYNQAYRAGTALIADSSYDNLVEHLRELDPKNSFLTKVEPTPIKSEAIVKHKIPMLSLAKAYMGDGKLERYIERLPARKSRSF